MNVITNAFKTLRVWTGLADASESRLTPSHGWLLPSPVEARRQRDASDLSRVERAAMKGTRER